MTASPNNSSDILDVAALNDLKSILDDALIDIAKAFLDGLDADVAAIVNGLPDDATAVRIAAHSLKGSASNMGGKALSALSSAIEKAAHAGDMAHCSILVAELPFLANRTRQALQAYIDQA